MGILHAGITKTKRMPLLTTPRRRQSNKREKEGVSARQKEQALDCNEPGRLEIILS
jgi:hypothetical protein